MDVIHIVKRVVKGFALRVSYTLSIHQRETSCGTCKYVKRFDGVDVMAAFKQILQISSWEAIFSLPIRAPPWSSGSVLDHRSLPPVFESQRGHIWRLFRLSLRLITFGSRSAHLAYLVHKSGRKTSIISLPIMPQLNHKFTELANVRSVIMTRVYNTTNKRSYTNFHYNDVIALTLALWQWCTLYNDHILTFRTCFNRDIAL